ncbi:type II secretion system F family protein [Ligilactobacillus agilis]|uniref:type II secretion system F family protein n=1 Tax=Ligilactobacillus agilis TaxID=1601 RepID=UPI000A8EB017|nr:type II secretion system F family protein [Ligilactobacillus agilis]
MILVIVGVYLGKLFWWWKKQPTLTKHHWYSQLPLVGKFYRQYSYYYLSFNLGLLLQSGMDFQQICYFLGDFDKQSLLYQLGSQLRLWLEKGDELREFIALYPFIPPELVFFFSKGQTQAELSKEILLYSQLAYQKLLRQLDNLINLVQPLLFLVIAAIIIGTYLAILLPLYRNMGGLYR